MCLETTALLDEGDAWFDIKQSIIALIDGKHSADSPQQVVWALGEVMAAVLADYATEAEIRSELEAVQHEIAVCRDEPEDAWHFDWRPSGQRVAEALRMGRIVPAAVPIASFGSAAAD